MRRLQIGVMGPSRKNYPDNKRLTKKIDLIAEEIGYLLAKRDCIVLTGGCNGVMDVAMRGANKAGGITIGFPGRDRCSSNNHCDIEILSDVDIGSFAYLGITSVDALITIPYRSAGTDAEIALAYRRKVPNIFILGIYQEFDSRYNREYYDNTKTIRLYCAKTPEESVSLAIKLGRKRLNKAGYKNEN